jgi:hypothetical protein
VFHAKKKSEPPVSSRASPKIRILGQQRLMTISELINDKTKKAKAKAETLSAWLLNGTLAAEELMVFAETATGPAKATCIEAFEFATRQTATIVTESIFEFLARMLLESAPRVKWESARVIANTAHLFPKKLRGPVSNLLLNTSDGGTVVRWASACALGEILKLNTSHNKELEPAIEAICATEGDTGVRKKYLDALAKLKKSRTSRESVARMK